MGWMQNLLGSYQLLLVQLYFPFSLGSYTYPHPIHKRAHTK
uniref:Uncharacterized protein n=1 Tax=Arundo donax TaxID=35708 RepID=A0A0A9DWU9_ARUDO